MIFLVCFCCASRGKDLGFLARCFKGGGVLAFEVVKSGDSAFFGFGMGEIKKRGARS